MDKTKIGSVILAGALGIFAGWVAWGMDAPIDSHNMHTTQTAEQTSMEKMMHDMNASLEGKTGDTFDAAFLSEMIVHHKGAVAMAETALEVSKRPELIKLARDIIAAQNKEIELMKRWQAEWFR